LRWTAISQQSELDRKKANKPSQQKPTNKAAARLKPTNFTILRTQLQLKRQTKLKKKKRIEFKGLMTTNKGAPKQTNTDHVAGKYW